MKTRLLVTHLCLVPVLGVCIASADEDDLANRFNLTFRLGLNIHAEFKNLGLPATPGGPSVTGLSYADGFVRPNSEPNELGLSWNWGYESARQVVGDNIVMTRSQPGHIGRAVDEPYSGLELTYNGQLGRSDNWRWGVEAAINYTSLNISGGFTPAGGVLTAHAFSLGGSTPPVPPYAGSPEGPGITINDTPGTATLTANSCLDSDLLGFRLGPYVEYPLGDHWVFSASAGFALGWADSEFRFRETVAVGGAHGMLRDGRGSESELLPGGFIAGSALFHVTDELSVFGNVQFQSLTDHVVRAGSREVRLDLSQSVFVAAGLSFSF